MKSLKNLTVSVAVAALLSACTTTSSELKRPANGSASKATQVSSGNVKSVSDVVDDSKAYETPKEDIKSLEVDISGYNDKLSVRFEQNFKRAYFNCPSENNCVQVAPVTVDAGNSVTSSQTIDARDAVISRVENSEGVKSLIGRKIPAEFNGKRILLMSPDVELYELGVALQEPNAFWTSIAKNYVTEISAQYFQNLGYEIALYKDNANNVAEKTGQDLISLHEDVGISIIQFQQNSLSQLPTLATGKFDWQLGATAKTLSDGYGADYGLFIYLRDSYSSGGRVAAQLMMAVLFGAHVQGGTQVGFSSLVNLKTGEIEWFNRIISTTGDLRTFPAAINATDALFEDIPL